MQPRVCVCVSVTKTWVGSSGGENGCVLYIYGLNMAADSVRESNVIKSNCVI